MPHEPRLTTALRQLLHTHRVAALGTLDEEGLPAVSMVPFALDAIAGLIVVHVSGLAAHTRYLQLEKAVSLLVTQAEQAHAPVHDLPRVTVFARAKCLKSGTAEYTSARAAYLARFPEAEPMTELGDFCFIGLEPTGARHVAGFGAARRVEASELRTLLAQP